MRKRYRVLRFLIVLMKASAIFVAAFGTVAWIIGGSLVALFSSAVPVTEVRLAVVTTSVVMSIAEIVAVWLTAAFQWGFAELLDAIVDMSESSRATSVLLFRLLRQENPGEPPDYMKSLHGVWDDAPPARTPDEHWKRAPAERRLDLNGEPPRADTYRSADRARRGPD